MDTPALRNPEALAAIAKLRNATAESRRLIEESRRLKEQMVSLIWSTGHAEAAWEQLRARFSQQTVKLRCAPHLRERRTRGRGG
jgi:hypothetical protein